MNTQKSSATGKIKGIISGAILSLVFFIFLTRSDIAIDYMKKGLKLCSASVIPALFPFMVISELIVKSGIGQWLGRSLARPLKFVLGVSEGGACAFFLGAVCGFPIGARALCSMYDGGHVSKEEFTRVMTFCNNPGSAFVISAVGVSLFGSQRIGVALYVCVLLSALIVGAVSRLFFEKSEPQKALPLCHTSALTSPVSAFVGAIQGSALSTLHICAFIAFFSAFVGCLGAILTKFDLHVGILAALFGFFEISSGVGEAAGLSPDAAMALCAAILSWSGLSVHLQIMTVCFGRGISFKPYFLAKGAQAILSAALMGAAIKLFPLTEDAFSSAGADAMQSGVYSGGVLVCAVFFAASLAWAFWGVFGAFSTEKKFFKNFSKRG